MRTLSNGRVWLSIAFWAALAAGARAELPIPRFDRIFPLGVAAGSSVEVDVAGPNLEDARTLRFEQPGITTEFIKENRFKISVAADVPDGTYDVRLVGRFGVSNPRLFAVSHGLTDVAEKEPNNTPTTGQPLAINSAVNGTSDANGQDIFQVAVRRGQRFWIECDAGKIDSDMDATLTVLAADGRILASNRDYFGRDPFVDLVAPEDGELAVVLHDHSYRGGMAYRLVVSDLPHIENLSPRAVEPGKPTELVAFGRNFGTAGELSNLQIEGRTLEQFRFTYTAPADGVKNGGYRFFDHPVDHTTAPTAATCTLVGEQVRVPIGPVVFRPQPILFADGPVTLETEPNDDSQTPQQVTLPLTLSGRFDKPRDADWFSFVAPDNGTHYIDVYSERIAGRADPFVVVMDEKDNRIADLDDFGHRTGAFDGHLRDPVGTVNLQKDKRYRVLVQDRYGRGGPRLQYVLTLHAAKPDFFAASIHRQNQEPSGVNIWRGGATFVECVVHSCGGFAGPLEFSVEGLPPGLHAAPTHLSDGNIQVNFAIWADPDAAEWAGPLRIMATGKRGDEVLRHEVRPHTKVWANSNTNSCRPMRELIVAAGNQAPFGLRIEPAEVTAEQGSKVEIKVLAARHWADFASDIRLSAVRLPGNFKVVDSQIQQGQNEARMTVEIAPNAREGQHTFLVQGQAQVPFDKDPKAAKRPNTLVTMPSQPITVTVTAKGK